MISFFIYDIILLVEKMVLNIINLVLEILFFIVAAFKTVYFIIGFFSTRKFKKAKKNHKYGICIAARNEEKVIGNLLDSIKKQDYPQDLITVFVVADNCTDKTAEVARKKGAIVYERFDDKHKTKGFALQYLFKQIEKDYITNSFEGYFIFDADNLLNSDYISKMNNAFDSGCKIITSYRNSKNFDENWIASSYAMHWIRSIRINHRARSVLRLATNIQGTGFLFANEIVKNGWKYTSLTEDRALTADAVAQGYQITYQDEAMFYDEQPTDIKVAFRQRIRWAKGHLQAFAETGPYLFINIFLGKAYIKNKWNNEKNKFSIIESIRHRFASFDTLVQLTPISVIALLRWIVYTVIIHSINAYNNGFDLTLFHKTYTIDSGIKALVLIIIIEIILRALHLMKIYLSNCLIGIYILISEKKNIKKMSFKRKVISVLTWPTFDSIGRYSIYIALFKKVEWVPTPHKSKITINDLNKKG